MSVITIIRGWTVPDITEIQTERHTEISVFIKEIKKCPKSFIFMLLRRYYILCFIIYVFEMKFCTVCKVYLIQTNKNIYIGVMLLDLSQCTPRDANKILLLLDYYYLISRLWAHLVGSYLTLSLCLTNITCWNLNQTNQTGQRVK